MAGLYIHIPFCSQFCIYCDFYSTKNTKQKKEFISFFRNEADRKKNFYKQLGLPISTIYFGGGSPSILSHNELHEILDIIESSFGIVAKNGVEEFTIECNPDDLSYDYLKTLKSLGFNRLSIGVQSFEDTHLKWMNRRHDAAQAIKAFTMARELGFDNISLDLIFGFSLLSDKQWNRNLNTILELSPEHVSAYQLSIEPSSKLGNLYEKGEYRIVSQEKSYDQYMTLREILVNNGYEQYEISNFCLPHKRSKHNSSYWNNTPYLGLGPSAHSFDGEKRFWNTADLKQYGREIERGEIANYELLSEIDKFNEKIMLSLRLIEGLNIVELRSDFNENLIKGFEKEMLKAIQKGNLIQMNDKIIIPPEKLFISDGIIRDLFV